ALFAFDKERRRFRLDSVHPGSSVEAVLEHTGFDFDRPAEVPQTPVPDAATLALIRGPVAREIARTYPRFAASLFPDMGQAP
ncbi:MAG: CoA synthetase, partial [Kiloniellales bacterium]